MSISIAGQVRSRVFPNKIQVRWPQKVQCWVQFHFSLSDCRRPVLLLDDVWTNWQATCTVRTLSLEICGCKLGHQRTLADVRWALRRSILMNWSHGNPQRLRNQLCVENHNVKVLEEEWNNAFFKALEREWRQLAVSAVFIFYVVQQEKPTGLNKLLD
jgi:hypothetical protein